MLKEWGIGTKEWSLVMFLMRHTRTSFFFFLMNENLFNIKKQGKNNKRGRAIPNYTKERNKEKTIRAEEKPIS